VNHFTIGSKKVAASAWGRDKRTIDFILSLLLTGDRLSQQSPRTCGSCTACCDGWLQIEVRGHQVRRGKPCPFSVEHQCSIYDERPQHPCREFICGWLTATSPLPEWMRPDKSDMIMLAANFIWHGLPVDVVVAAGDRPKKKALDWLMKFSSEKKRLLIYQVEEDWFAFGPPAFQAEIAERIGRGEKPWAD
jgi:hypothetical protein